MLATRCLYLSSIRMSQPNICSRLATAPLRMQPAIIWQAKPLAVAYSKDVKPAVLFSSSYSFMSSYHTQNYPYSTVENNNIAVNAINNPLTTDVPLSTVDSSTVAAAKPTIPKTSAEKRSESNPLSSSSSSATVSSKSPSTSSPKIESFQSFIANCSAGQFKKPDIKLPSRDQMESFLFKSLVYLWDFTYYITCMSLKLFDTYVIKNPTIQHYWKLLLKRMDQARKETTTK